MRKAWAVFASLPWYMQAMVALDFVLAIAALALAAVRSDHAQTAIAALLLSATATFAAESLRRPEGIITMAEGMDGNERPSYAQLIFFISLFALGGPLGIWDYATNGGTFRDMVEMVGFSVISVFATVAWLRILVRAHRNPPPRLLEPTVGDEPPARV
jgi:hypothetical protein